MAICPRCYRQYSEYPSLSRVDNKTNICSNCGTEEAFIDFRFLHDGDKSIFILRIKELDLLRMNETNELKLHHYNKLINILQERLK